MPKTFCLLANGKCSIGNKAYNSEYPNGILCLHDPYQIRITYAEAPSYYFCTCLLWNSSAYIVCATKEDGQLMRLSFLKLESVLWENNLFPFRLDKKDTYFDIVLLTYFIFFFLRGDPFDLPFFDSLISLYTCFWCFVCICPCSAYVCVCLWIRGHPPVFEWFDVSCLFCLYGLSLFHPFYPFHPSPARRKQMWTCKDRRRSQIKIPSQLWVCGAAAYLSVPKSCRLLHKESPLTRRLFPLSSKQPALLGITSLYKELQLNNTSCYVTSW